MRRLSVFLSAAAFVVGVSVQAGAGVLTLSGGSLGVSVGRFGPGFIPLNGPVAVTVSSGAGSFTEPALVFGPATFTIPVVFSGVPTISGLTIAGFGNATKFVNGTAGTAVGGLAGTAFLNILQLFNLTIPLSAVGGGGTAMFGGGIIVTVFGQGWTTGVATVMGVTTTITTPGTVMNIVNTVTVATGSDNRTPGHKGMMTLVSGFTAATNVAGNLPGFAIQKLIFSPEPGTLLLLGSGAVGLGLYGRRRMRQ